MSYSDLKSVVKPEPFKTQTLLKDKPTTIKSILIKYTKLKEQANALEEAINLLYKNKEEQIEDPFVGYNSDEYLPIHILKERLLIIGIDIASIENMKIYDEDMG